MAGKREEAIGKLQCEAQLSEARGKLSFLERSVEAEAQRMRQLQQELAAVTLSEQQLRREAAETRRDRASSETLPEQLRALMEVQLALTNGPQARRRLLGARLRVWLVRRPFTHISTLTRAPYLAAVRAAGVRAPRGAGAARI